MSREAHSAQNKLKGKYGRDSSQQFRSQSVNFWTD